MDRLEQRERTVSSFRIVLPVLMLILTAASTVLFTVAYLKGNSLSGHIALLSGFLACNCFAGVRSIYLSMHQIQDQGYLGCQNLHH